MRTKNHHWCFRVIGILVLLLTITEVAVLAEDKQGADVESRGMVPLLQRGQPATHQAMQEPSWPQKDVNVASEAPERVPQLKSKPLPFPAPEPRRDEFLPGTRLFPVPTIKSKTETDALTKKYLRDSRRRSRDTLQSKTQQHVMAADQKQPKIPETTQQAQLSGDFPNLEGPPGWMSEYDSENSMTAFYPPDLPEDRIVEVTVTKKESRDNPEFVQMLPMNVHERLVSTAIGTCTRVYRGRAEGPTKPEYLGKIVHSTLICILPSGRRISKTIFTVKSTTQFQLVMLSSDENLHEAQLPTVRAMLHAVAIR